MSSCLITCWPGFAEERCTGVDGKPGWAVFYASLPTCSSDTCGKRTEPRTPLQGWEPVEEFQPVHFGMPSITSLHLHCLNVIPPHCTRTSNSGLSSSTWASPQKSASLRPSPGLMDLTCFLGAARPSSRLPGTMASSHRLGLFLNALSATRPSTWWTSR